MAAAKKRHSEKFSSQQKRHASAAVGIHTKWVSIGVTMLERQEEYATDARRQGGKNHTSTSSSVSPKKT